MRYTLVIAIFFFITSFSFAQTNDGSEFTNMEGVGLSASFRSGELSMAIPIWVGKKSAVVPSLSASIAGTIGTDIGVGMALRTYFKEGRIRPYIKPGIVAFFSKAAESDDTNSEMVTDFGAILNFGGEYFVSKNFSFAIEMGLNATFSDENSQRFGNPGSTNLNTATLLVANIYF